MITLTTVLFGDSLRSNGIIDHLFYVFSCLFIQIGLGFCVCTIFYWTKRKSFHREFGNNVFKESNCFLVCEKRCAYIKIVAFAKCIFLLFIHQRRIIMLKRVFLLLFFGALGLGFAQCTETWNIYRSNWESNFKFFEFWILHWRTTKMTTQKCVRMYIVYLKAVSMTYNFVIMYRFGSICEMRMFAFWFMTNFCLVNWQGKLC